MSHNRQPTYIEIRDVPLGQPWTTSKQPEWWTNRAEVATFARALNHTDQYPPGAERQQAADILIDYFVSPWQWSLQHQWWEANRRTVDQLLWEAAAEDGYRTDIDDLEERLMLQQITPKQGKQEKPS